MKEQLLRDLLYIRDMLRSMAGMNQEEIQLQNSIRYPIEKKEAIQAQKKTNPFIFVLLGIMLVGMLITTPSNHRRLVNAYENAAFNDQFAWEVNHADDNEPYPGYSRKKPTLVSSMLTSALQCLPLSIGIAAFAGIAFTIHNGRLKKARELENKEIEEYNQNAELENSRIWRHNEDVMEKINNLHARQEKIIQQYQTEIAAWFPPDYAYLTDVNFFIDLVQKNRISCLNNPGSSYEAYRTTVINEAADRFDQDQERRRAEQRHKELISKEEELISKEEQLVHQQIFGNMINMANLITNAATYDRVNDAANSLADINAKIRRY